MGSTEKGSIHSSKPPVAQLKSKLQDKRTRHHFKVSLRASLVGHGSKRAKTGENNERETKVTKNKEGGKEKGKAIKIEEKPKEIGFISLLGESKQLEKREIKPSLENINTGNFLKPLSSLQS